MDERKRQWKENNEIKYTIYFTKKSKIVKALEKAAEYDSIRPGTYIKQALVEKLEKDGWLTEYVEQKPGHPLELP